MKKDWKEIAKNFLKLEKESFEKNSPPPEGIVLLWKGKYYLGSLQKIAEEIVLLSKTSYPVEEKLIQSILELQPDRPKIIADDHLDLEGRYHILRRVGNRLTECTPEQTEYILMNPPRILEI